MTKCNYLWWSDVGRLCFADNVVSMHSNCCFAHPCYWDNVVLYFVVTHFKSYNFLFFLLLFYFLHVFCIILFVISCAGVYVEQHFLFVQLWSFIYSLYLCMSRKPWLSCCHPTLTQSLHIVLFRMTLLQSNQCHAADDAALSWSIVFIWSYIIQPAWKTVHISKQCYYCRPSLGMNNHAHLIPQGCTLSAHSLLEAEHTVFIKPCPVIGSFLFSCSLI